MTYRRGKCGSSNRFSLLGSKITADGDYSHEIRRQLFLGRKIVTNLDSVLKNKDITLPNKSPYSQGCGLSTSHVWMWVQNHKEGRVLKSWCFPIVVLEKTLESPLNFKEIKPVDFLRKSALNIHWKNWCWSSNTLATWCKQLTNWKIPWFWERLKAGEEEGHDKGWDGWMASSTQQTWTLANFGK